MNKVELAPGYFPTPVIGRPIAFADIYVGVPDTDPTIVANQKQLSVQQENGTIVAIAQPAQTGAGGVPMYNGSPVTLLTDGDYSLAVHDSGGSQIYYVPSDPAIATSTGTEINVAMIGDSLTAPSAFSNTWADQFKKMTNQMGLNINLRNFAVVGQTFQTAITVTDVHESGTRSQVEQVIAQGADIVLVMLGANDTLNNPTRTEAQVIQDGTDVYDALKAGLPNAQIVLVEETPHDVDSLGLVPASATNIDVVPISHQTITYKNLANCRVNNSTWENTAVSAQALTNHQTWGNVITALRLIYDDNFNVDLWKIARLGSNVDVVHMDRFGHMWVGMIILRWFKGNNDIDNKILDIGLWTSATASYLIDFDDYFTDALAGTADAERVASYFELNLAERMSNWFYSQRKFKGFIGPDTLADGSFDLLQTYNDLEANAEAYFAWDAADLITTNANASTEGKYGQAISPQSLGVDVTAGVHSVAVGFKLADNTVDVFEKAITLTNTAAPVSAVPFIVQGSSATSYNTTSTVAFTTTDLSAAITPTVGNDVLLTASLNLGLQTVGGAGAGTIDVHFLRNGAPWSPDIKAVCAVGGTSDTNGGQYFITFLDTSPLVGANTYLVEFIMGTSSGATTTAYFNGQFGTYLSFLTLQEVTT